MWEIAITNQQILGSTSCISCLKKIYNVNRFNMIFFTSDIAQKIRKGVLTFNQLSYPREIINK